MFNTTTVNDWAERWSTWMVGALGQSLLWTALAAAAAALLWRASPAARCWLWRIVAVKLLLVPFWPLALPLAWLPAGAWLPTGNVATREAVDVVPAEPVAFGPPMASVAIEPEPVTSDEPSQLLAAELPPPASEPLSCRAWLMIAWAAVVAAEIAAVAWQWTRLRRLLRSARPADEPLQTLVAQATVRLGLARVPRVLVVDAECSPLATGIWRPVIILPRSVAAATADGSLLAVLAHELAHVKRWDLAWVWIAQLARTLYCFNPLVYWIAFRLRLESELACDAWAMAASGQAADEYADLLVRLVGRLSQPAALGGPSAVSAGLSGGGPAENKQN